MCTEYSYADYTKFPDPWDRALNPLWDGGHIKHFSRATLTQMAKDQGFEFAAFEGCGEGLRSFPFLWSGMLMIFRKPSNRRMSRIAQSKAETCPQT